MLRAFSYLVTILVHVIILVHAIIILVCVISIHHHRCRHCSYFVAVFVLLQSLSFAIDTV